MRSEARTEPGASVARDTIESDLVITTPQSAVPTIEEATQDTPSDLLNNLRRDRPPPKLSPREASASEGGKSVAYYGGPKSVPARYETPGPEPLVEIAITSPALTMPSARKLAEREASE